MYVWVRLVATGRVVYCDAVQARQWAARGEAVVVPSPPETAARTAAPQPAVLPVEVR